MDDIEQLGAIVRHAVRQQRHDAEGIAELDAWATTAERVRFIKHLKEYFDVTSLVLIVRALREYKP